MSDMDKPDTRMWPITTVKCAGTKLGICICLQTGMNLAPGKEFPFHKVSSGTLIIYLRLMRKERRTHNTVQMKMWESQ